VGTPFALGGSPVHQFANTSAFVERTVVDVGQVVRIDPAIDPEAAALLSCSALTGAGAVFNRAQVGLGDTVVVIGAGGVGLNAVQAAVIAGADRVIAVDSNPGKAPIAASFGATDFVHAAGTREAVRDLVPGGVDHVLICIGRPELVPIAVDLLAPGGTVVLVGFPGGQTEASFTMAAMYQDKSILGCRYGSSSPHRDIPRLAQLHLQGRFKLDELITCRRPLAEASAAFDDLATGSTDGRTVLTI
jgi:S-(hydroxymethyl)glutathione dehydrogenase/alcohol dehydrogenase